MYPAYRGNQAKRHRRRLVFSCLELKLAGHLPRPFGVFYETERACYEEGMAMQIEEIIAKRGKGDLDKLLRGNETWTIS